MRYIYLMEYNSAVRKTETMKFVGKLIIVENITLNEVTETPFSLSHLWLLALNHHM